MTNPLDKARKLAQEMIEKRDGAFPNHWGPWEVRSSSAHKEGTSHIVVTDHDGTYFTQAEVTKSKNHDNAPFVVTAANTAKPLAEMVLRMAEAIEKLKKQRDSVMGDYTWDRVEKIEKGRERFNAEIQAVLEGEK